jgi:two-component system, NarL family, response regulator LiaR
MTIRILLAEDHAIVRQGLRELLNRQEGMSVVAEADNGRTAVALIRQHNPDVAIVDIGMPELNGTEATRAITAGDTGTRVIALSMHNDPRFVERMFQAGARGYVLKGGEFKELMDAIRAVMRGEIYLSPQIAGVVVRGFLGGGGAKNPGYAVLTRREREVLQLVAEGRTTKEMAAQLGVSVKTIEACRSHIMAKLDLHSIAELTKYAIREGLTSLQS